MILYTLVLLLFCNSDSLARHFLEIGEIGKAEDVLAKDSNFSDTFLIGEVCYFNYKFDKAIEFYRKVGIASEDANDAISRIILIEENMDNGLQDYATAELLSRKGKASEGVELLRKLLQSKSPIASWATILLIEVLDKGRSFDEAIKECKNFIRYFPTNDKLPQVKLKLAKIYVKLGKKKEAREIYKEILLLYPNSTVAPISRGELENL